MGKAYFHRKGVEDRPVGDFYSTPKSLVTVLFKDHYFDPQGTYLEPCAGEGAISEALQAAGRLVTAFDLYRGEARQDFLTYNVSHDYVITNPPFSLFDSFVAHGKKLARRKLCVIGRLNYFGCVGRSQSDIWHGLSEVLAFNRMIDFRTPKRDDGRFHVGGMVTAWFIFNKEQMCQDTIFKIADVQPWATLGAYKPLDKN